MLDLKKIIAGFINENESSELKQKLAGINIPLDQCEMLTKSLAVKEIEPEGEESTLFGKVVRSFQKHIGGGPAEFIRDVKNMDEDQMLFIAHVDGFSEEQVSRLRDLVESFNIQKTKFFGSYSVEHMDVKDGHDEEMPLLD